MSTVTGCVIYVTQNGNVRGIKMCLRSPLFVRLAEYLGWDSEELMGQSVFEFYHALDNFALDKSFKSRE